MTEHTNQGPAHQPPPQQPQGGVYGAPAQPPPPRKRRAPTWLIVTTAVIVAVCGIGTIAAIATSGTDLDDPGNIAASASDDAPAEPAADKPDPPARPEPDGTVSGNCDLLLFTGPNDQSEFAASVDVENTGNIGVVVKVTASFDQLGRDDYVLKDTVKVRPGDTKSVNLSELITHDEVARHQDGGYECRIDGEITDTFGDVQGR